MTGAGFPSGLEGEDVPIAVRVVTVARRHGHFARKTHPALVARIIGDLIRT